MNNSLLSFYCFFSILFLGCDNEAVNQGLEELYPVSGTELVLSNGRMSVTLVDYGGLQTISLLPDVLKPNRKVTISHSLGPWYAGNQNGIRSNIMSSLFPYRIDRFQLQHSASEGGGLFTVNKADFLGGFERWPSDFGAPTYQDGSPKMNGDVMAWGSFTSAATTGTSGNSFFGLDIVVNPYMFEDDELQNIVFVRYEITNESSTPIENLHMGFGGDVDLALIDTNLEPINGICGRFKTHWNNTGYDRTRNYSYTYVKPDPADGNIPLECYGTFVGYSIVGSSRTNGLIAPALAHTVVTRWEEQSFEAFQETKIQTPSQVLFALQGLSSEGNPMIDPTTGEVTSFAYTGNPITETGWVDYRKDVRSVQSISPITLAPGEKVITIVAIFAAVSPTYEQGFSDLTSLFDKVISQRSRWDY